MTSLKRSLFVFALFSFFANSTRADAPPSDASEVRVEYFWAETRHIPGVTNNQELSFGEAGETIFPHLKPILTNQDVAHVEVTRLLFPGITQAPVQYSVVFHLTDKAQQRLAETCGRDGCGLLAALVDGDHRGTASYLKRRDASKFTPSWGFTTSKAKVQQITATFAASSLPPGSKDRVKPDYFPCSKGSVWEYRRTSGKNVEDFTVRIEETTQVADAARIRFNGDFPALGWERELEVTTAGVFFSAREGRTDKPLLIKTLLKVGDEWDSQQPAQSGFPNSTAIVNCVEEVEVPAGRFKAMKITYASKFVGNAGSVIVWYADGVGLVKRETWGSAAPKKIELTKYTRE